MAADPVLVEHDGPVTTVTLNRPEALNALNRPLRAAIVRTFRDLVARTATEVVILTGAGRAFTVGLDLKELGGETAADGDPNDAVTDTDLMAALEAFDRPIIGAINGYAITGGFELALMCDILIAGEDARFADTHARVGVVPGWGLSQKLSRILGPGRAKELSLTGNYLDAEHACAWGLVNRVVPTADLLPVCRQLAADICTTDRVTREAMLDVINAGFATTLAEGMALEQQATRRHAATELTPEKVAARRAAVQDRGRQQGD